jgi:aminomethyltransferase
MDDVEAAQVSDQFASIGIFGPTSATVLASAGIALTELRPLQMVELDWRQSKVRIVCGERETFPSFEIWVAPNRAQEVLNALIAAGAAQVSEQSLELYRVALGIPRYGQDIRERDLPQETEQQRALNFNKGCYIGQEIVERIRSRGNVHRTFTGFSFSGPPAGIGVKIQYQGKDVGEITTSATIPSSHGDRAVALGYIRREIGVPGKEVQVGESVAIVAPPPFVDLLKD